MRSSWLADTVAKVVDWNDTHQVCILANSVELPDGLGDHARVTIRCLLQRFKSAPVLSPGTVGAMLVRALARRKSELDSGTIHTVQRVMLSALHDSDAGVRINSVNSLAKFGGEDMIDVLRVAIVSAKA
jgi:hypothetical protein